MRRQLQKKLVAIAAMGIITASCSAITGDEEEDAESIFSRSGASSYVSSFTPTSIALTFPASLQSNTTALSLVNEEAEGLRRLRDVTDRAQNQIANLQMMLLDIDAAQSEISNRCTEGQECTIEDDEICVPFTAQMAKSVEETLGNHAMSDEEFGRLDQHINQIHCLPKMIVELNVNDGSRFNYHVKFERENESTRFSWNEDRSVVSVVNKYEDNFTEFHGELDDFEREGEDGNWGAGDGVVQDSHKGLSKFVYDSTNKVFTMHDEFTHSFDGMVHEFTDKLRISGISEREDVNRVRIVGSHEGNFDMQNFEHSFVALVDDNGGMMENTHKDKISNVSSIELTEPTENEVHYEIVLQGTPPEHDAVIQNSIGGVHGDGSQNPTMAHIFGSAPSDLGAYQLMKVTHQEGQDHPTFEPTNIGLVALDFSVDIFSVFYREQWNAEGNITAWCFQSEGESECGGGSGNFEGEHHDSWQADPVDHDESNLRLAGVTPVQIFGNNNHDIPEIFLSFTDLEAFEAHSPEMHEHTVGFVHYHGDPDNVDMNEFIVDYWDDPARAGELQVYKLVFVESTGELKLKRMQNARIESR